MLLNVWYLNQFQWMFSFFTQIYKFAKAFEMLVYFIWMIHSKNWKKEFFAQAIESKIIIYVMLIVHWITITFQFLPQKNEENKNTDFSLKFAHLTLRFIQFICVFHLKVELCYENKYYYENQFFFVCFYTSILHKNSIRFEISLLFNFFICFQLTYECFCVFRRTFKVCWSIRGIVKLLHQKIFRWIKR